MAWLSMQYEFAAPKPVVRLTARLVDLPLDDLRETADRRIVFGPEGEPDLWRRVLDLRRRDDALVGPKDAAELAATCAVVQPLAPDPLRKSVKRTLKNSGPDGLVIGIDESGSAVRRLPLEAADWTGSARRSVSRKPRSSSANRPAGAGWSPTTASGRWW